MRRKLNAVLVGAVLLVGIGSLSTGALASQIDLNTFGSEGAVDTITDETSATLSLDDVNGYSLIQNDPASGTTDSGLSITADTALLSFSFDFYEADGSDTIFSWWLTDADGTWLSQAGEDLDASESGLVTLDLSDYIGQTLGISFQLLENNTDASGNYLTGSTVNISDLQLTPVPVPATLILLGSGILALFGIRKRNTAA